MIQATSPTATGTSVSGLMLTLSENAQLAESAIRAIWGDTRFTPGARHGLHLPVVLEAENDLEAERIYQELREMRGVVAVDVVYVQFA